MGTLRRIDGCRVELRDAGGALLFADDDADLQLDGANMSVLYWDDDGAVVFSGTRDEATGAYALRCRSRPRSGSLRSRQADGRLVGFEGDWSEGDERGSWTLMLPGAVPGEPSARSSESVE